MSEMVAFDNVTGIDTHCAFTKPPLHSGLINLLNKLGITDITLPKGFYTIPVRGTYVVSFRGQTILQHYVAGDMVYPDPHHHLMLYRVANV